MWLRPFQHHSAVNHGLGRLPGWGAVCAAFGLDPLYAWIGTPDRHLGWATWVIFGLMFLVGQNLVTTSTGSSPGGDFGHRRSEPVLPPGIGGPTAGRPRGSSRPGSEAHLDPPPIWERRVCCSCRSRVPGCRRRREEAIGDGPRGVALVGGLVAVGGEPDPGGMARAAGRGGGVVAAVVAADPVVGGGWWRRPWSSSSRHADRITHRRCLQRRPPGQSRRMENGSRRRSPIIRCSGSDRRAIDLPFHRWLTPITSAVTHVRPPRPRSQRRPRHRRDIRFAGTRRLSGRRRVPGQAVVEGGQELRDRC